MATRKGLSLIYEIQNFADTYLGKVTKFQGDGLLPFEVRSYVLCWKWKTPPGMNRELEWNTSGSISFSDSPDFVIKCFFVCSIGLQPSDRSAILKNLHFHC